MSMKKIVSFGEPMIELAEKVDEFNNKIFVKGFGGDSSNFAIACARQGANISYITALGNDSFGNEFMELYQSEGVDTSNILIDDSHHTGVYFIHYDEKGHHFSYLRKGSAASHYHSDLIPEKTIKEADCLFVSGITQAISDTCSDSVFRTIEIAKANNVLIAYDPNVRLKLWSVARARAIIHETVKHVDIFMPSYEDAVAITNLEDENQIIDFYHDLGVENIVLKLGSKGVLASDGTKRKFVAAHKMETVDQTGAGDTFDGSFIANYLLTNDFFGSVYYANAAAALSTLGIGAVAPIPTKAEVDSFLKGL